jgi:hypothetical protein
MFDRSEGTNSRRYQSCYKEQGIRVLDFEFNISAIFDPGNSGLSIQDNGVLFLCRNVDPSVVINHYSSYNAVLFKHSC